MNLPSEIYSVDSVRAIDQQAIKVANISGYALMCRAGRAAFDVAVQNFPDSRRWQVVCGAGNNAGDGYVVARLAAEQGIEVSVSAVVSPDKLKGDAATAYMDFAALGGTVVDFAGALDADATLLIDALLGSGIERDVEGRFADAVAAMNGHRAQIVALDLPSGLHGDTGIVMGVAVRASHTITFVGLKSGLFLDSGPDYAGQLHFSGLDIPASCFAAREPALRRIDGNLLKTTLAPRQRSAHKGDFGHVLVVGGGPGMAGAVLLCGEAALRSGAGLVSVATHASHSAIVASRRAELMCHGITSADDLDPLLDRATVVAVGPGLGTGAWSQALYEKVLQSGKPLVVDADALNLLAENRTRNDEWILTPHPGEAARLLQCTTAEIQRHRRDALARLQRQYGGSVVLKGSGTLVSSQGEPDWLCSAGNPGMAGPGMGDVLTGVIAAFRAQGVARELAAVAGVEAHARAGDAAARTGQRGMLASDLIAELKSCVNP